MLLFIFVLDLAAEVAPILCLRDNLNYYEEMNLTSFIVLCSVPIEQFYNYAVPL